MKKFWMILLFPCLLNAQVRDTCKWEIGVSMNQFIPAVILHTYILIEDGHLPNKKNEGIYPAYDGYGLNFRNYCRHKLINRLGINYNQGLLVKQSQMKFLSGSIYAGHEWFGRKRMKHFYIGTEIAMRYQKTYFGHISNYYYNTLDLGPFVFTGFRAKLSKRLSLRSEVGMGIFIRRAKFYDESNYKYGYGGDSYRFGSLELYYNF